MHLYEKTGRRPELRLTPIPSRPEVEISDSSDTAVAGYSPLRRANSTGVAQSSDV